MEKYERNGFVYVLFSPAFGGAWSADINKPKKTQLQEHLMMDKRLVEFVMKDRNRTGDIGNFLKTNGLSYN